MSGIRECSRLDSVEKCVQGSWDLSHRDFHQCGKFGGKAWPDWILCVVLLVALRHIVSYSVTLYHRKLAEKPGKKLKCTQNKNSEHHLFISNASLCAVLGPSPHRKQKTNNSECTTWLVCLRKDCYVIHFWFFFSWIGGHLTVTCFCLGTSPHCSQRTTRSTSRDLLQKALLFSWERQVVNAVFF